ncbi:ATP-binding protein [Balneolales bacterium ANBcel1]|nr:ATP-binding protein [Balneolales bacterium ANBcel1]
MTKREPGNPFLLSGYIDRRHFCDREQELSQLHDHFRNERNVVLYSWRRIGKTALIQCFFDELSRKRGHELIYVDLLATRSASDAIRAITQAVYQYFGRTERGFTATLQQLLGQVGAEIHFNAYTGQPYLTFRWQAPRLPEQTLEQIGAFLAGHKKPVIIGIDEFQHVSSYSDSNGEALFRAWTQQYPELRFLFSGSHRGMMESMFTQKSRPFYRSAQQIRLEPIPLEAYAAFIRKHFKKHEKEIGFHHVEEIYRQCRGQTYAIQLVCNKLFAGCDNVTEAGIIRVFDEIITQEKQVFSGYGKLLTDRQWQALVAIAKGEPVTNPLSKEFVQGQGLGATSTLAASLKALQEKELIIQDYDGYYVHDVLLSRWLKDL